MNEPKKTSEEPLSDATRSLISSIENKNLKARLWAAFAMLLLLAAVILGVVGIYKQNQIAGQNQKHIDCIVKLFTKPLPPGARARTISNPSTTCNINFTQ